MGRKAKWVVIAVLILTLSLMATAQVVKKAQGGLHDLQAASPRTWVGSVVQPLEDVRVQALSVKGAEALSSGPKAAAGLTQFRTLAAGFDRFVSENGTRWQVQLDRRTGLPALVEGEGLPWIAGEGNTLRATGKPGRDVMESLSRQFIADHPEFFPVSQDDLVLVPEGTVELDGYLYFIRYEYRRNGIPVEGSNVVFRLNHGNLIQFGAEKVAPLADVDTLPSFDAETARQILEGYVGGWSPADQIVDAGHLSIIPFAPEGDVGPFAGAPGTGLEYRLVYNVVFHREGEMGTWEAKIDAHTGDVLTFRDRNEYGNVTGGIYPNSNLDTEVVRPLPFLTVSGTNATQGGVYSQTSGTVTAALTGKYVKVTDSCGTSSLSVTAPADLAFSKSTGTDCTTPGVGGSGNTHAARTGYYHLTLWKEKAMGWLTSNTWLQGQLTDKVNLSQTCNAYWDGSAVNFFKSGGGCSNTGELPTVFLHEVGHGLDSNDGSASSTVGSSESYGDLCGILATHSSCLGVNFIPGNQCTGYGNACTNCTGIRDADYTKHTNSTSPATPAQLSGTSGFHCSTSSSYPGPCGREGHCESYIMSEAGWDLAAKDLPAAGFDANTSWFIADRLFYLTRPTSGDSYTCSGTTANGCGTSNWYVTFRAVDDDNGNLSDGTPHAAAIYAAFNRHGIACSTTVNTSSATCASIGQPVLTATAGNNSVSLSWAAVTNATKYMVLRNELSSSAGMGIVTTVTTTSYTDTGLANGITYYYSLVAVGSSNACFGTLAAVKSATPTASTTTYSLSGTVSGAATSGVTITLSGAASATTTTATGGTYSFSGLANGSYTVTPTLSGYTFSPSSTAVTVSGANQTGINFTATAAATYSISGTVSGAIAAGVTMTLSGASSATTTTATGGTYTFSGLANGTYTVTPSLSGYTFSPTSTSVTIASANQTGKNFTSTASTTYSISGTVSGAIAAGVTMTLSGASSATTTTATGGTYTFSGLANGTYTVTPSLTGYTFSPTSTSVTIASANQTGKNFTSTIVTGDTVLTSGVGVSTGALTLQTWKYYTIAVPSGATGLSITLTGLSADLDLYVNNSTTHPTTSSYYGRSYNGSTTNESLSYTNPTVATWSIGVYAYAAGNATVTATVTTGTSTYSISGAVSGAVTSGVTMTLSGAASATTTTATGGTYTFSGLANGTYTVTPSLTGYTFSPTSTSVTISGANQTGKNFTATAVSGDTPLTSGTGVSGSLTTTGTYKYYTIAVPTGATNLSVTLTGLSADLDLYVNNSTTHPTSSTYYGASTNSSTTNESLSYASPTVATWSIGVYAYAAGSYTVTATVTTGGGGGTVTLLTDGFENTGWSQVDTSGDGTWSYTASGTNPTCSKHGGSYMAMFNSYTASSGVATRLYKATGFAISSTATSATLTFWMYHDPGYSSYADKIQVQVSTNSGSTWTSVGSAINRYAATAGWTQHTIDLSAYKGSTVNLGFLATSAYGNNMFVDDALVTAVLPAFGGRGADTISKDSVKKF